jgi:trigger factor
MKAEQTDITAVRKSLDIEVSQEVVDGEVTSIAKEFRRQAKVPGFRPGKAPLGVVKTRYRDEIRTEVLQNLLPKYFSEAAKEQDLDVVHSPGFENVEYSAGEPLRFKAVFEVYPRLDITNHSGIPVDEISTEVVDSDVDQALERIVEEHSEMTPVDEDREVREGDFVEISFNGDVEGDEEADLSAEKVLCEIGGATTLKEFTENLTGTRAGEEKTFPITYKDDHPDEKLAGKHVVYTVQVESIKEKVSPKLDDEFAQSLGDFETLDGFKKSIRENLEAHKRQNATEETHNALLGWLQDNNEFEVPDSLIEHQVQIRLQRLMRNLTDQGVNPQRLDVDWGKIRADQHAEAVRDVRGSLILEHLAKTEDIRVEDEEVEKEIDTIAAEMNRPKENVREVLGRNDGLERIKGQIQNKKVLIMLEERAKVVPTGSLGQEEDGEESAPQILEP